ncbi:MAG: type II secretion system secretin GspD [Arenimonas sp.]
MLKLRLPLILLMTALTVSTAFAATPDKTEIQMKRAPVLVGSQPPADENATDKSAPADEPARKTSPATIRPGTGQLINQRAASSPPPNLGSAGDATFNFEGESVQTVVKVILGDLLQQNYVIAPNVTGTVTLATPRPVSPAQAVSLLEMVLGWNNARLIWSDGRYNVVPSDQAVAGNLAPRTGSPANARGYEVRAIPLKFISATEMEKLLKPYARDKAIVQVDNTRNMIVIGGTRAELQNYIRTIEIFDVDWLAGMSVGIFPLQSAEASKIVTELEKVFGENGKTPLAGMFRFMPLEGQNSVMVITSQPKYLRDVETWIERMDAGGEGVRLYVYEVKNIKAVDLADQLSSVFGNGSSGNNASSGNKSDYLQPGLEPVEVRTVNNPPPANAAKPGAAAEARNSELSIGSGEVSISAVEESNSVLVRASPGQWESIRRAIERLDSMPLQVHVEAQVIEVKLSGDLKYGVSWFFGNAIKPAAGGDTTEYDLSQTTNQVRTFASSITPVAGMNWTFIGPNAKAVVNLLDGVSDLRVLSAPSLLVRNNVEANFDSGQQIPVASTILNPGTNSNTDNTYSQVQFRQTGVSLKVKPRVSSNGMVFMEITQDISTPSLDGPEIGGNISVDNQKLKTEAAVQSGETVVLAGLIKTTKTKGSAGVPFLSRIPIIGSLFGQQTRSEGRQEVLILITPTVIRDPYEARKLTDEYGERFRALDPLRKEREKAAKK